jgi:hypothetical protein
MSTHISPRDAKKDGGRSLANDRIEEIRARRQARGQLSDDPRQRLTVAAEAKDPRWEYRWVVDRETRVQQMQRQDWDFAPPIADERDTGMGTRVERVVNDRTVTNAEKGFLMRKPKEFFEEDRNRKHERTRQSEKLLERGDVGNPNGLTDHSYIPKSGMKIDAGSYKP